MNGKNENVIEVVSKGIGIERVNERIRKILEEQKEIKNNKPLVIEEETILKLTFWEKIKNFFKRKYKAE